MAASISKEALLKILGENKDALAKLEEVSLKADELRAKNIELTPQINKAEALAQAAILKEELKRELKVDVTPSLGARAGTGLLGLLTGGAAGTNPLAGGSGILGLIGKGGLPAILSVATAVSALLVLLDGLVSGIAAAGAGIGAFGLLALPTIDKIKNGYTAISAAQTAYNTAVAKENIAPTKANATAVTTALTNLKVAQQQAGPMVTQMIGNISLLKTTFDKLAQAQQPMVLSVLTNLIGDANEFLPNLAPMATAAGGAINKLTYQIGDFFASADFKKWLSSFDKLIGPSITALGQGFGKVAAEVGKLFTIMSAHDVVHAINITFDAIAIAIHVLGVFIGDLMLTWDHLSNAAKRAWADVKQWTSDAVKWLKGLPGQLLEIGKNAITSFVSGLKSVPIIGQIASIAGGVIGTFKHILGIGSPSRVLMEVGRNTAEGFRIGLTQSQGGLGGTITARTGGGSGSGLVIQPGGSALFDQFMAQFLRQFVHINGGGGPNSAQIALGQTR
jgi:hypothetical protein